MAITYTTNKNTGVKYAYETISVWSPKEKKTTAKRKYLGRVHPVTGEIIPTSGMRGKKKKAVDPIGGSSDCYDFKLLYEETVTERDALASELKEAQKRILALERQLKRADEVMKRCEKIISQFRGCTTSPET